MLDKAGFRKDNLSPFFNQVALSVPIDKRQDTPFIVHSNGDVKKCETLQELLEFDEDTEVLQAWPGAKRSDVFYFTVGDIKNHLLEK